MKPSSGDEHLDRVIRYARQWGVGVVFGCTYKVTWWWIGDRDIRNYGYGHCVSARSLESSRGPNGPSLLDYAGHAAIHIDLSTVCHGKTWVHVLHELAHAVCPICPARTEEIFDTMGFEIWSIQWPSKIGSRGRNTEWRFAKPQERVHAIERSMRVQLLLNLFQADGTPTFEPSKCCPTDYFWHRAGRPWTSPSGLPHEKCDSRTTEQSALRTELRDAVRLV